jgi:hypothetical protein
VVDANALVSMLEVVTALLLAGLKPDLNGLCIPQSWLFVLAQRMSWPQTALLLAGLKPDLNGLGIPQLFGLAQRMLWPQTRHLHFTEQLLTPLIKLSHEINSGCRRFLFK